MKMKWALVLALVLCCGSTRGQTENESGETKDNSGSILVKDYLLRNDGGTGETGDEQTTKTEVEPEPVTEEPPAKDLCEDIKCENGIDCKEGKCPCDTKPGLSGDRCEIVDGCAALTSACDGIGKSCIYDPIEEKATCDCGDDKKFDGTECKDLCEGITCQNGIVCAKGKCKCDTKPGLSGDLCEIADGCDTTLNSTCAAIGKSCIYDPKGEKATCDCGDDKKFDGTECKDLCEGITCQNGIVCKKGECKCDTKPGLSGDLCEIADGCDETLNSTCGGIGKGCIYDPNTNKKATCDCGDDKKFDGTKCKETCDDDASKCPLNTECKLIDGYSFCVCKKGLTGDKCDVITDCQPSEKYANCVKAGGNCTHNGTNSICLCKDNEKKYDIESETCRETCDGDAKKCPLNSECKLIDGNSFCVCSKGWTGDKCDLITDCQPSGKYENCTKAGGNCTHDGTNSVCLCKDNKEYDTLSQTCRTTCDPTNSTWCQNGAKCEDQDGKNFCTCVPGLTGDLCEEITDCKKGEKYSECAQFGDCKFSNDVGKAVCICTVPDFQFDIEKEVCRKACKDDSQCAAFLFSRCGEPNIDGHSFCVCKDNFTGDNCETHKDCLPPRKYANCVKAGGRCEYVTEEGFSKCSCKDKNKQYDTKSETCRATCDPTNSTCENEAKCEEQDGKHFCTCVPGLTGDFCQNITACETGGTYENCSEGGGTCKFSNVDRKAVCDCVDGKHFDTKMGLCRTTCDPTNSKCVNGAQCEVQDGKNFCTCVEGLTGDWCNIINECQPSGKYEKCESSGGTCTFSNGNASCSCGTGKLFDDTDGQCKGACGNEICRNGVQCKDGKCECPTGLSGKDCGIIDGCTDALEKTCQTISTKCIYDSEEENKASCECTKDKQKFDGKICKECDCGTNGNCFFVKGEKLCKCNDLYIEDKGICESCDCGKNGKCRFVDHKKTCDCDKGYLELDDKCKECDCGDYGKCSFQDKKKNCTCEDNYSDNNGICTEPCKTNDDCEHKTTCKETKTKGVSFCDCKKTFTGHFCEKVVACETGGTLQNCENSGGKCSYNETEKKAVCECNEEKKFDEGLKICRKKCKTDETCKHGGKCQDKLCICPEGTSGDDCSTVDGCDTDLKEKCNEIEAICVYDNTTNNATCQCNNNDKMYKNDKCIAKWCDSNPCKAKVSVCVYGFKSGFCKCTESGKYYDYATNDCIDIDKCLSVSCKDNEYCTDGKCECDKNHVKENDECKRKNFCDSNPCSLNATCIEGKAIGTAKCECSSDKYFNTKSKNCEVMIKEEEKCKDKDCGPFGYCVKKGDTTECACKTGLAERNKTSGVCILNGKTACLSKKVLSDNPQKCNCSGMYKDSTNGITCEYMTCGDEAAQKDCESKGAYCVDAVNKEKQKTYECKCSAGQTLTTDKGCVDACSDKAVECFKNQQTCYLNENGTATCKCPPGFTETKNGDKTTCQLNVQFSYILKELPVMAKEFLNKDQSVNKVKLNQYVIKSMKALSSKSYEFASVQSFRISDDVMLCDVWLKFKEDAEQDVKRWRSQVVIVNDSLVLPPSLKLSSVELSKVTYEKLEFCSPLVYQTVCGRQGSKCEKNACSCVDGFDVVGPTVQVIEGNTIMRCEDIDECGENKHSCKNNSECMNILGGHYCKCNRGFHKKDQNESEECVELCSPNPCTNGDCAVNEKENRVECSCTAGFKGSYCTESDDKLKQAQHSTKVVGAVLGTILAVTFVAVIAYVVKLKKNSYSEDFSTSPRDNSEMAERPLRGISNRGYQ